MVWLLFYFLGKYTKKMYVGKKVISCPGFPNGQELSPVLHFNNGKWNK